MSNNQVGLAGEFAVLSQLYFRKCDASLTLGNTKGVDILVSNPRKRTLLKIEVKTKTGIRSSTERNQFGPAYSWQMHERHEGIKEDNLYYCFVLIHKSDDGKTLCYKYFLVPSKVVAKYVKEEHRWWQSQKRRREITNRIFLLGTDADRSKYPIPTPLADDYENRWDLLGV